MEIKKEIGISNKLAVFRSIIGEVMKSSKYTENYISAQHSHIGSSSNMNISSDVLVNHEIFIKEIDTGREISLKLYKDDILVREGNKVALTYIDINKYEYLLSINNYHTGAQNIICNTRDLSLNFIPSILVPFSYLNVKIWLIISIITLVIAGFIFSGSTQLVFPLLFASGIFIISMPIAAVIAQIKINQIVSEIKNKLDSHLSEIKIS